MDCNKSLKTSTEIRIPCYDTSQSQVLRPSAMFNYCQELSNDSSDALGFGYDDLIKDGLVWIISRMHVIFHSSPRWRDTVKLCTWHKGRDGVYFLRDYLMTGEDGTVIAAATSSWAVLNLQERSVVTNPAYGSDESLICREDAIPAPCPRMVIPKGMVMEPCGKRQVRFSDIDRNRHTNNAMYVSWAMDALDFDFLLANPLKEIFMNFRSETRASDEVELYRNISTDPTGRKVATVTGMCGGKLSFIAKMIF
ncbi:MAG: thioesterase [Bacteroidales bacterium]|nr:thioesterase [Bacteroidales bacterium]